MTDLDPETAMCFGRPGHTGWLVCQVHGREIQEKVATLHGSPDQPRPIEHAEQPRHVHPSAEGMWTEPCPACELSRPQHAPSGEPVNKFGSVENVRAWHLKTHSGGHKPGQECQVAFLLAECDGLRAHNLEMRGEGVDMEVEISGLRAERDQYLAELQQARAVVEAAREACGYYQSVGGPWERLRLALRALDHSPAAGEGV